jgi:hypothetical protein
VQLVLKVPLALLALLDQEQPAQLVLLVLKAQQEKLVLQEQLGPDCKEQLVLLVLQGQLEKLVLQERLD